MPSIDARMIASGVFSSWETLSSRLLPQPLGLLHQLGLTDRLDEMLLLQNQRELKRECLDRLASVEIERSRLPSSILSPSTPITEVAVWSGNQVPADCGRVSVNRPAICLLEYAHAATPNSWSAGSQVLAGWTFVGSE